eukprot:403376735
MEAQNILAQNDPQYDKNYVRVYDESDTTHNLLNIYSEEIRQRNQKQQNLVLLNQILVSLQNNYLQILPLTIGQLLSQLTQDLQNYDLMPILSTLKNFPQKHSGNINEQEQSFLIQLIIQFLFSDIKIDQKTQQQINNFIEQKHTVTNSDQNPMINKQNQQQGNCTLKNLMGIYINYFNQKNLLNQIQAPERISQCLNLLTQNNSYSQYSNTSEKLVISVQQSKNSLQKQHLERIVKQQTTDCQFSKDGNGQMDCFQIMENEDGKDLKKLKCKQLL